MEWNDESSANRLHYRSRAHQRIQLDACVETIGDVSNDYVLDYGCGYGDLIPLISCARYVGVERNPAVLEGARAIHPHHRFIEGTKVLPADVIVAVASIQCDVPNAQRIVREIGEKARRIAYLSTCAYPKSAFEHEEIEAFKWEGCEIHEPREDEDFFRMVLRKDNG